MQDLAYSYQHIPYHIDPTIFRLGFVSLGWYSLMYILAFCLVYFLLRYRIRKGESEGIEKTDPGSVWDLLLTVFLGLLIGGRLGYVIFYDFQFYFHNPLAIISPFDPVTGGLVGIYGMSFHGGLIGGLLAAWIFLRKNGISFIKFANFAIPAVPLGYFFGRIGNFMNGELWGRQTGKIWGMYFPNDELGLLRHPSQIYEAVLEGLVLFIILWALRNNPKLKNNLFAYYLIGYGTARIFCEFFREPDYQIGFIMKYMTLGQLLSIPMALIGIFLISQKKKM